MVSVPAASTLYKLCRHLGKGVEPDSTNQTHLDCGTLDKIIGLYSSKISMAGQTIKKKRWGRVF